MTILAHAQSDIASLDADIASLGENLAALQNLARSLPAGVTFPTDKRAEFCRQADLVEYQFERLTARCELSGIAPEAIFS